MIGLDGMSPDIVWSNISNGRLPNLEQLIQKGSYGRLVSTIPPITGVAIPSFYTGCNPAKLNVFGFKGPDGKRLYYGSIKRKTFWEYGNIRSLVVNLRCTYKPRPFNGVMIAGDMLTPGEYAEYTFPEHIKEEVRGFHSAIGSIETMYRNGSSSRDVLDFAKSDTDKKMNMFTALLEKGTYDFSLFWDGNLDLVQHFLWDDRGLLDEYYSFIDCKLGDLLERHEDTNIFIVSDHGFDAEPVYNFHLNKWLEKEGYLVLKGSSPTKRMNEAIQSFLYNNLAKSNVFSKLIRRVVNFRSRNRRYYGTVPGANSSKTKAYLIGWWGIKLQKDDQANMRLISEIVDKLKKIEHLGVRIFKGVWSQEYLYGEVNRDEVPDIFFLTDPRYKCVPSLSRNLVTSSQKTMRAGNHFNSADTLFIAKGPSIAEGYELANMGICDVAPTILHIFGLPLPTDMDGRVLNELFREGSEPAVRPVRYYAIEPEHERIRGRIKKVKS